MVEEAFGCWRVVGLFDGVFDGVVKAGDGFALVADLEALAARCDGGCDECPDRDGGRDGPLGESDLDGVVFGDVSDERDSSVAHGEGEVAFLVEVVANGDVWWPAQLVRVASNVLGWGIGCLQCRGHALLYRC